MDNQKRPWGARRGSAVMMLGLLLVIIAVLVGWAYLRNPPGTSSGVSAPTAKATGAR